MLNTLWTRRQLITTQATAREHGVPLRMACFMIGIERVATAVRLRGFV